MLFSLLGKPVKFRSVPLGMLRAICAILAALGRFSPKLADKAESRGSVSIMRASPCLSGTRKPPLRSAATPSAGSDTLRDHYIRLIRGELRDERGYHAVFQRRAIPAWAAELLTLKNRHACLFLGHGEGRHGSAALATIAEGTVRTRPAPPCLMPPSR